MSVNVKPISNQVAHRPVPVITLCDRLRALGQLASAREMVRRTSHALPNTTVRPIEDILTEGMRLALAEIRSVEGL